MCTGQPLTFAHKGAYLEVGLFWDTVMLLLSTFIVSHVSMLTAHAGLGCHSVP